MLAKLRAFMDRLESEGWPEAGPHIDAETCKNLALFGEVLQISGGAYNMSGILAGVHAFLSKPVL